MNRLLIIIIMSLSGACATFHKNKEYSKSLTRDPSRHHHTLKKSDTDEVRRYRRYKADWCPEEVYDNGNIPPTCHFKIQGQIPYQEITKEICPVEVSCNTSCERFCTYTENEIQTSLNTNNIKKNPDRIPAHDGGVNAEGCHCDYKCRRHCHD